MSTKRIRKVDNQEKAKRLNELEEIIENSLLTASIALALALHEIKNGKLFLPAYKSFDGYLKKRWQWSKSYAYKFTKLAETYYDLKPFCDKMNIPLPQNEAQFRQLAPLSPENRKETWQVVCECLKSEKPTALLIKNVVSKMSREQRKVLGDIGHAAFNLNVKASRIENRLEIEAKSEYNIDILAGTKRYNLLLVDPPLPYDGAPTMSVSPEAHYPVMTFDQLASFDMLRFALTDCLILVWSPNCKLYEVTKLMVECWGFDHKSTITWEKEGLPNPMGSWVKNVTEHLLIGSRGDIKPPAEFSELPSSLFRAPCIGEFSQKPEEVFPIIAKLTFGLLKKAEIFARVRRDGWDFYGNEELNGKGIANVLKLYSNSENQSKDNKAA